MNYRAVDKECLFALISSHKAQPRARTSCCRQRMIRISLCLLSEQ